MVTTAALLLVIAVAATVAFVLRARGAHARRISSRLRVSTAAVNEASATLRAVYPLWARAGPFQEGWQSSMFMLAAVTAAQIDERERDSLIAAARQHAKAFDANPEQWEALRQEASRIPVADDQVARMREALVGFRAELRSSDPRAPKNEK